MSSTQVTSTLDQRMRESTPLTDAERGALVAELAPKRDARVRAAIETFASMVGRVDFDLSGLRDYHGTPLDALFQSVEFLSDGTAFFGYRHDPELLALRRAIVALVGEGTGITLVRKGAGSDIKAVDADKALTEHDETVLCTPRGKNETEDFTG